MKKLTVVIMALCLVFCSMAYADLNEGLVAYYPFNGNADDESGNGNNGTVEGATLTADRYGTANSAYKFDNGNTSSGDGIQVYFDESSSLSTLSQIGTISHWVKFPKDMNATSCYMIHMGAKSGNSAKMVGMSSSFQEDNNHFIIGPNNGAGSGQDHNGWTCTIIFQEEWYNTWIHLAWTTDGIETKSWVNGVYQGSCSADIEKLTRTESLQFGRRTDPNGYRYHLDGSLDDIRIYNRALNESEIQELYNEGNGGNEEECYTQADIDAAVQKCKTDSASCGITVSEEGFT